MASFQQDQTNVLKLFRLINELGTEALKMTFDAVHPPGTLQTVFSRQDVMRKLTSCLRRGVLHKDQWDKIYPSTGTPNSKDFDITILFILLRSVCGLLATNDRKWTSDPRALGDDQSTEANISRIRWFRNDVVHNHAKGIDLVTFEEYWKSIAMAVVGLGVGDEDVKELKDRPLDEDTYLKMLLEWKTKEQNLQDVRRSLSQTDEELKELSHTVRALVEKVGQGNHELTTIEPEALLKNLSKTDFTGEINFFSTRHHPSTRQWIFEAFEQWYNDQNPDARVFLVTGNPGMGKSVVAAVICKRLETARCLGGAFFCQYSNSRFRSARVLLQSITHSLSQIIPEYKEYLLQNLSHNFGRTFEPMTIEELFAELLQGPLNMISAPAQYLVIVIDGLDECEYESKNEILRLIAVKFPRLPRWLKFFVTSRPEVNVMERLQILRPFVLQQDDEKNIDDIRSFVRSKLSHVICPGDLGQSVDAVTQQAQGLMLLAYFLVTYVEHTGKSQMTFDDIRQIYPRGISSVYEDYLCHFLNDLEGYPRGRLYTFLSTVAAARAPLPVDILTKVLEGDKRLNNRRKSLSKVAVLDSVSGLLPVVNGHIHVFHKSFTDWLSNSVGHLNQEYAVDVKKGHRVLGEICLEAFKDAKGASNSEVPSALVTYALQHGVHHLLQLAGSNEGRSLVFDCITDLELIHAKLLCPSCPFHNVMEEMLLTLDVFAFDSNPETTSAINDCLHILRRHALLLSKDPLLVYQFLFNKAKSSKIQRDAKSCIQKYCRNFPWIEVYNKAAYHGPVQASDNCSSAIIAADVSPNGKLAVFGCSDGAVVLWSLRTARKIWIRYSEKQTAKCCLFAPDGSYIIFGFLSHVYSLEGESVQLFPKITMEFEECVFQAPENLRILTRDSNGALDVWDSNNGSRLRHRMLRFGVLCCTFSICGTYIVAVTNQEVYLLNSDTCATVKRVSMGFSPLVQPRLMRISFLSRKGTVVLLCQNHRITFAFSIHEGEIRCLDLPKDVRILGTARNGDFALVDDTERADLSPVPFPVMNVPHLEGLYLRSLTAVAVDSSSCLAWEGNTFFLFDTNSAAYNPGTVEQLRRLIFLKQTNEKTLLISSFNEGITVADSHGNQEDHRNFQDFGSFCILPSRECILISRRNKMCKTLMNSSEELEQFKLPAARYIWDIRFLNGVCILLVARLVDDWFDALLLVFDTEKWQVMATTEGSPMKIFSIDVFSDGNQVITSDEVGTLVVWDTSAFTVRTKAITDFEEGLCICKCAPDGRLVASFAVGSKRVHLWQSCPLQLLRTLEFPSQSPVIACGFSSSSDYFVSLDQNRVLQVWATKSGHAVNKLEFDHRPRILAICPETDNIAVALDNGNIMLGAIHLPGFAV